MKDLSVNNKANSIIRTNEWELLGTKADSTISVTIPNITIKGTDVFSGPGFTLDQNYQATDSIDLNVSGTVNLALSDKPETYQVNAAGITTKPGRIYGFSVPTGKATFAPDTGLLIRPGSPFGALLLGNSTLGFKPIFPVNADNGLNSSAPPTNLTIHASLGSLFGSGLNAGTVLGFRVNDVNTGDNGGTFQIKQSPFGDNGSETLTGSPLNDTIFGGSGNDIIYGLAGEDSLSGGVGHDVLKGGLGLDTLVGDAGNDTLVGDAGNDSLDGGLGNDLIVGGDGNDFLLGNQGNDRLQGDLGNDTLDGGLGNDTLNGGLGQNIISGLDGNDSLQGDSGSDTLDGGMGNDIQSGFDGNDILYGWDGNDTLNGGVGNDTFIGGSGNNSLDGGVGSDLLSETTGNDTLSGSANNDILNGGGGNDFLMGTLGGLNEKDILTGQFGNDIFFLGNSTSIYYNGDGSNGYGIITDLAVGDTIQLKGLSSNYTLIKNANYLGSAPKDTAIATTSGDIIGVIQDNTSLITTTNSPFFVYL